MCRSVSKHAISLREDDGFRVRSSSLQCSRMVMPSSSWARIDEKSVKKVIKVYQNKKHQRSRIISVIWSVYQYYYLIIISVLLSWFICDHIHPELWSVDLWMPRSASNRLRSKRRPAIGKTCGSWFERGHWGHVINILSFSLTKAQ